MDKNQVIKTLGNFIAIESVSADSKRYHYSLRAIEFLTSYLKKFGFIIRLVKKDKSPPLVIASRIISSSKNVIGIYGHYDVQPEDPIDEWDSPPFTLTIKNGKLFGRGVADNKGHVIQNIIAVTQLITEKKLDNSIIFILEGEEESGSGHFEHFISREKKLLSEIDVFYLTDVGMYEKNVPQIFYGLRGLVYFELVIRTGKRDLHSGVWGNRVLNPAQVASHLFSKMKDEKTGRVLIPGFYDGVRETTAKERELLKGVGRDDESQKKLAEVYRVITLDTHQPYLSTKIYPSLDINGMVSGYGGEGAKTIIPSMAIIKFSTRLVEYQNPDTIEKKVRNFIQDNLPPGAEFDLKVLSKDYPFYTSIDNNYVRKTADILAKEFGNDTKFNRTGGSIPAAEILERYFKKPIILTGFTLPDDNIHSPNENFDEEMFWKGIEALKNIYSKI